MLGTGKIISVAKDIRIRQNAGADGGRKTVALVCPKHGFRRGAECPECVVERSKSTVHINTGECYRGWYEHIDAEPIFIESKKHLVAECEKRGVYAKALVKPKSQGRGYEHKRH
jgi:hypothetical protein